MGGCVGGGGGGGGGRGWIDCGGQPGDNRITTAGRLSVNETEPSSEEGAGGWGIG